VTLNSGAINVSNGFGVEVGRIGTGVLNINGGTFTVNDTNSIGLVIGDQATAQAGTVNLSGGVLAVRKLVSNNGTNALNFNGGTLQATSTNAGGTFWNSSIKLTANVRDNGGTIDNNGTSITVGQALVHSTIGGDNATDGGMTFKGSGAITLAGVNTYTGATRINGGTLTLANSGSLASTTFSIAAGAVFDVSLQSSYSLSGKAITLSLDGLNAGSINAGSLALDLGGTLTLNITTGTPAASYALFTASSTTGNFGTISLSGNFSGTLTQSGNVWTGSSNGYSFSLDQTTGALSVAAVPEPGVCALLGLGLTSVLLLRRRCA
jgi:autotransporter-associated beta strand protein